MTAPVFCLAIPTTADWRPERADSLKRLRLELSIPDGAPDGLRDFNYPPPVAHYKEFREKAPNWVWSRDLWRWGVEMGQQGATHLVQLQDDVLPMPGFWPVLRAMVEGNPIAGVEDFPGQVHLASVKRSKGPVWRDGKIVEGA